MSTEPPYWHSYVNFESINPEEICIDDVSNQIAVCFGLEPLAVDQLSHEKKFEVSVFETQKLLEAGTLTDEEINALYALFFSEELEDMHGDNFTAASQAELATPANPFDPHPVYVIRSLHGCLEKLTAYDNFAGAVEGMRNYIDSSSSVKGTISNQHVSITETRKWCLDNLNNPNTQYSSAAEAMLKAIDECPLYTTQNWFNGINIHTAFLLRDATDHSCQWIFKPTAERYMDGYMELDRESVEDTSRECTAYALNYHRKYPLPATYQVEIKGYRGSVQLFVENTKLNPERRDLVSIQDLQALFIFDLLFSNLDRNSTNYLFVEREGAIHVVGIDHDACMKFSGTPLRLDYLEFDHAFNIPLMIELAPLLTDESINEYAQIMRLNGMEEKAIQWMDFAAKEIRKNLANDEVSAEQIFQILEKKFNEEHVT